MLTKFADFDSLVPTFGSMRRELERAFTDVGANGQGMRFQNACPISLWQDEQRVHVDVDVPGMRQDQLDLRFEDGKLWIRGERTWSEEHAKFEYNERRFGRFERVVALSDIVDPATIDAVLEDGVLHITLMKRPEAQPQSIRIRCASPESGKTLTDSACSSGNDEQAAS